MNKIAAVAADYQHLKNFCRAKDIPLDRFVHISDPRKMMGMSRGYSYIVVSEPYDYKIWYKMQEQLRAKGANRLPLDINEWPLTEFT